MFYGCLHVPVCLIFGLFILLECSLSDVTLIISTTSNCQPKTVDTVDARYTACPTDADQIKLT
uniref:Uncharacterized protein n=1 Tax=Arion vulgaris TaxID=1028688 RepID=A0A0B6ZTZ2_9EUPU